MKKYWFKPFREWHLGDIPEEARPRLCSDTKGVVVENAEGAIVAAALMDSWTENSCMIHVYIGDPRVIKHRFCEEVFNYVFNTSGRSVIIGATPADNKKALKFNAHVGFEEVTRIPDGYAKGIDYVITQCRKENCRWLEPAEEQETH